MTFLTQNDSLPQKKWAEGVGRNGDTEESKLGGAGDNFGDCLCVDCADLLCISGHNQFINKNITRPNIQILKSRNKCIFTQSQMFVAQKKRTDGSIFRMCKNWKERKRDRIKLSMRSNRVRRCRRRRPPKDHALNPSSFFLFSIRF